LAEGSPDRIVRNPDVIEAYLGKNWLDNEARDGEDAGHD